MGHTMHRVVGPTSAGTKAWPASSQEGQSFKDIFIRCDMLEDSHGLAFRLIGVPTRCRVEDTTGLSGTFISDAFGANKQARKAIQEVPKVLQETSRVEQDFSKRIVNKAIITNNNISENYLRVNIILSNDLYRCNIFSASQPLHRVAGQAEGDS